MKEDILFASLEGVHSLAIIGMEKNTGKTTFLNTLVAAMAGRRLLALTSIGRDGEAQDVLGGHAKPRIFVEEGTIVITARGLLRHCDITMEVLETTGMPTAMGEVVFLRAKSGGFVELAGPSRMEDLKRTEERLRSHAPDALFIMDGALSRNAPAAHVAEACVLCTGASLSPDMGTVVEETARRVELLTLEPVSLAVRQALAEGFQRGSVVLLGEGQRVFSASMPLSSPRRMLHGETAAYHTWGFRGAFTEGVVREWVEGLDLRGKTLVVEDGTRVFLSARTHDRLKARGLQLGVLQGIDLRFLLYNPTSPMGHVFPAYPFRRALEEATGLMVMDTKGRGE